MYDICVSGSTLVSISLKLILTKTLRITSSGGGGRESANITGHVVAMGTGDGRCEPQASRQKEAESQFSTI